MSTARENDIMMSRDHDRKRADVVEEPDESGGSVKVDSFEEFSGYTTLHGLRFIGDHTSILPRRVFWVLLVLLCGTLFGVQMHDRIVYFLNSPVNVNIKVNYPERAVFPSVTICNQNNFRISKAYEGDWLKFIYGYYDNEDDALPQLSQERLNASVADLFVGLAHAKEDLIVKCKWANEDCSAENFTTTLTSHGVCYTFNQVERPQDSLIVLASGVEHALQLTLNTEHYESLQGPHDTKGIKMMVTDQSKVPRVEEIGLAISTGIHAFVGISELILSNLRPPYGECGEVPLLSTNRYTTDACLTECETQYTYNKCGCRHFYMPDLTGEMAVCSIEQFLTCLQQTQKTFNNVRRTICTCPTSCNYKIYEPVVSYASSSHLKADIEDDVDEVKVKERIKHGVLSTAVCFLDTSLGLAHSNGSAVYFAANEISSKTNHRQRDAFNASLTNAISSVKDLSMTVRKNIDYLNEHLLGVNRIGIIVHRAIKKMDYVYGGQMWVITKNLLRGRDEIEEETFRFICQDHRGFIKEMHDKIVHLVANNQDDTSAAKVIYLFLQISLTNKQETIKRALENYTQLVDVYTKDGVILNYNYTQDDLAKLIALKPTELLKSLPEPMLTKQDFLDISDSVSDIESYVIHLFTTKAIKADANRIQTLSTNFLNACDSFSLKRILFYSMVIDKPVTLMEKRIEDFDEMKLEFYTYTQELRDSFINIYFSIKEARNDTIPFLLESLLYSMDYLNNKLPGVTKYAISNNDTVKRKLDDVRQFVESINVRAVDAFDAYPVFERKNLNILNFFLKDEDFKKYLNYEHTGNTSTLLQNLTKLYSTIPSTIEKLLEDYDLQNIVGTTDIELLDILQQLFDELDEYSNDHNMDEHFYRKQFLQVDVFFKELRSEQIDQQIGYDAIALLCDIGGATGLFIGGSLITVFEIAEFLLMCLVCKVCIRKTKAKPCTCTCNVTDA